MSLIQDALKRKIEEGTTHPEASRPVAPAQHPPSEKTPPAAPPANPPGEKHFPSKLPVILAVAFILIMLGFGVGIYMNHPQPVVIQAEPEPVIQPDPAPPAETPVVNRLPSEVPTQEEDVLPEQARPAQKSSISKPAPKVQWPEITFSGSAANGNEMLAIINGRMLSKGATLNGITVLQIGKNRVLLEYEGEKRLFRID